MDLKFDHTNKIQFSLFGGAPVNEYAVTRVRQSGQSVRIDGEHLEMAPWLHDGTISISITEEPASDGMSEKVYPYSVIVNTSSTRLYGTGTAPFVK